MTDESHILLYSERSQKGTERKQAILDILIENHNEPMKEQKRKMAILSCILRFFMF